VKSVWVILASGLFFRIVLDRAALNKLGLLCMALLDLSLFEVTLVDLNSGRPAKFAHVLAAIYLGFTVIAGLSNIQCADSNVSYKLDSGLNLTNTDCGWTYAKYDWVKELLACSVGVTLRSIAIFYIDNPENTAATTQ
jgi:hypothetical protein